MRNTSWLAYVYAALGLLCFLLASHDASAHWDGDPTADGHRYRWSTSGGALDYLTPHDAAQAHCDDLSTCHHVTSVTWNTGTKNWTWRLCNESESSCSNVTRNEFHCVVGSVLSGNEGSCIPNTGSPCAYDGAPVAWTAQSTHTYINVYDPMRDQTCLWARIGSAVNGACFNVTYEPSKWRESDEDNWTTANNDGAAIPDQPNTCDGYAAPVWPWSGGVDPFNPLPLDPSERCPAELHTFAAWPYAMGDGELIAINDTVCLSDFCRSAFLGGVQVCFPDNGYCWGDVELTGDLCDGSEDFFAGTDSGEGAPGTGAGETNAILTRIYDRIGQASNREVAGSAAIVGALAVLNQSVRDLGEGGGGGGGGECESESCEKDVPTLGTVGTAQESTQGFLDRVAGSDIVQSVSSFGSALPEVTECPTFSSDPIAILGDMILTITAQCDLWEMIAPVLSVVMLVIYTLTGAFIILRT